MLERSILVVTPDDTLRHELTSALKKFSPFVYGVGSLDKAASVLKSLNFSLVLIDASVADVLKSLIKTRTDRRVVLVGDTGEKEFPTVSFSKLIVEPEKALELGGKRNAISKRGQSHSR